MTGWVQLTGKTIGSAKCVRGALRAKNPLLCCQGALGRHLICWYGVLRHDLPDPDGKEWQRAALWPGKGGDRFTYANHNKRVQELFAAAGVKISKVTHAMRIFSARLADEMGLSDEVCTNGCQCVQLQSCCAWHTVSCALGVS